MKHLTTIPKPTQQYTSCNQFGYYCWTPEGGDIQTCPLCGRYRIDDDNVDYSDEEMKNINNF